MTGHRALEKKQITQGNNRKAQNPSGSPRKKSQVAYKLFAIFILSHAYISKRHIFCTSKKK